MPDIFAIVTIEEAGKKGNRYSMKTNEGWFSCFDDKVGQEMIALSGQEAAIKYYETKKGDTTYKNVKSIEPNNGGGAPSPAPKTPAKAPQAVSGITKKDAYTCACGLAKSLIEAKQITTMNEATEEVERSGNKLWFASQLPYDGAEGVVKGMDVPVGDDDPFAR